jgi:energy-coupling factor transport system substrate-specific component
MVAWGLAGAFGGIMKSIFPGLGKGLIIVNFAWGYLFGWIMNIWFWTAFISPLDWRSFVGTCVASFGFDTFHAVGNVIFYLIFGSSFIKILRRFQRKLNVTFIID